MHHKSLQKIKTTTRGFTLVELMVSLTIFSMVMVVSVGTLLIMVDANAKAQALYSASTNLSFALDSLTREIRTGYHYYCRSYTPSTAPDRGETRDCGGGSVLIFWREIDGKQIGYRHNSTEDSIEYKDYTAGGAWTRLTAPEIVIDDMELSVQGSNPYGQYDGTGLYEARGGSGGDQQPSVDILISGHVSNGLETDTDFSIQSHIVQRRLDLD
jgi:prepilin-type N-terminal cleavage/methylation domain-containing protein